MASELSRFIEDQLRSKGLAVDGEEIEDAIDEETAPLTGAPGLVSPSQPSAHTTLMGALRVEARVKEQQSQKTFLGCQRLVCVGGGLAVVLLLFLALIIMAGRSQDGQAGRLPMNFPMNFPSPSPAPPPEPAPPAPAPPPVQAGSPTDPPPPVPTEAGSSPTPAAGADSPPPEDTASPESLSSPPPPVPDLAVSPSSSPPEGDQGSEEQPPAGRRQLLEGVVGGS